LNPPSWHRQVIEQLSQLFEDDPDARAFVLYGSLADADIHEDFWSDVDAVVILAEDAVDRYTLSAAWLTPLGRLVGAERHQAALSSTLRVCLEGFRRFDLTFIAESALRSHMLWKRSPFPSARVVLWSRLPDLETLIASLPAPPQYQDSADNEIESMVDAFWFKASAAVTRVARNDLLVGLHLALGLAQDCLVLQMMRCDRAKKSTIHRSGGWGNDLAARFFLNGRDESGGAVLNLIRLCCEVFDSLAITILPGYSQRSPLLLPAIEAAEKVCLNRIR